MLAKFHYRSEEGIRFICSPVIKKGLTSITTEQGEFELSNVIGLVTYEKEPIPREVGGELSNDSLHIQINGV